MITTWFGSPQIDLEAAITQTQYIHTNVLFSIQSYNPMWKRKQYSIFFFIFLLFSSAIEYSQYLLYYVLTQLKFLERHTLFHKVIVLMWVWFETIIYIWIDRSFDSSLKLASLFSLTTVAYFDFDEFEVLSKVHVNQFKITNNSKLSH